MAMEISAFRALERHAARKVEREQGRARPTRVRFIVECQGAGEARLDGESMLRFDTYFLEEPTLSFGCAAIGNISEGAIPLATATVLRYDFNDREMFTGAEMGFRVQSTTLTLRTKFSLTFEGMALRTTAAL